MMSECDLVLSDCYASIVPQFHAMQGYINDKCIHSKLHKNNYTQANNYHTNDRKPLYHPPFSSSSHLSLIPELCNQINQHYHDVIRDQSYHDQINVDLKKTDYEENSFQSNFYETIAMYCWDVIGSIGTQEDLEIFYVTVLLGGVMYSWYQEKYMELINKIQGG